MAFTGLCSYKLLGYKEIDQIILTDSLGIKKRGELLATVKYKDYQVNVHMPVDGKVLLVNKKLLSEEKNIQLRHLENNGWIALIIPAQPCERKDLLEIKEYLGHSILNDRN